MRDCDSGLVDEYDIDETDELHDALFEHCQTLRTQGHTPEEIVARLRDIADSYEDHFKGRDSWSQAPSDKDPVLPGDSSE